LEHLGEYIEFIAKIVESAGVAIIAGGILFYLVQAGIKLLSGTTVNYSRLRLDLGKAILLGLEILVAADIIATVSTKPTMNSVLVLGLIVLIRTFLSFSLQAELEGKFPWQRKSSEKK
jgi:uncharacterized membrane protein